MNTFLPGEKLPNGAILVNSRPRSSTFKEDGFLVLAIYHGNYVTWNMGQDGSTCSGRYFPHENFFEAVESFKTRR